MTAEEIKELRLKLGLTQKQLAEKLGVTKTTIHNWERQLARPSPMAKRGLNRLANRA